MDQGRVEWAAIRLVAFDVDGTLYRQSGLRLHMARSLVWHSAATGSLRTLGVLRDYRRLREVFAEQEVAGFEDRLTREVASAHRITQAAVRTLVGEWIEQKPLPLLRRHRYPGVGRLFRAIRASGRMLGVLSDYPAVDKLSALELSAEFIISANDAEVGVMKPNPAGLRLLMDRAGVRPEETLLIGDRPERDGLAADRAGARCLIRTGRPDPDYRSFAGFDDPVFAPLFASNPG